MAIDLDSAIDAVARQMTDAEPTGALRAAVLERVDKRQRHPSPAVPRWAWVGAAAALTLAVATTTWLNRPPEVPAHSDAAVAGPNAAAPAAPSLAAGPAPVQSQGPSGKATVSPSGETPPRAIAARRLLQPEARDFAGTAPADDARVPALAEIEPLSFSTVEPSPLSLPVFEVAPLDPVPTIDIPSLAPGSTDTPTSDPKKEK